MNPVPFQPGPSAEPAAPAAPLSEEVELKRLSALFMSEPELIEACLESLEPDRTPYAAAVLAAARRAIERRPGYADLHYFAARAALRANEPQQAQTLLEAALRINPRYNAAMILAARACVLLGAHAEALRYLRQAVLNGADYADVHLILGDLWRQQGDAAHARRTNGRHGDRPLRANVGHGGPTLPACGRVLEIGAQPAGRKRPDELPAPEVRGGSDELPA